MPLTAKSSVRTTRYRTDEDNNHDIATKRTCTVRSDKIAQIPRVKTNLREDNRREIFLEGGDDGVAVRNTKSHHTVITECKSLANRGVKRGLRASPSKRLHSPVVVHKRQAKAITRNQCDNMSANAENSHSNQCISKFEEVKKIVNFRTPVVKLIHVNINKLGI